MARTSPELNVLLAEIESKVAAQEFEESLTRINQGLCAFPDSPELLNHKGAILLHRQQYRPAVGFFEQALALDPDFDGAALNCFKALLAQQLFFSAKLLAGKMKAQNSSASHWNDLVLKLENQFPAKKVTFYIPCFNVEPYIENCIQGILSQTYPVAEILVVDDGSTDRSIALAGKYNVRILAHAENKGLAAARNTALLEAQGEFIASLDTDAVPEPEWLEYAMLAFDDPAVAGAGGKLIEAHSLTLADRWRQIRMPQHRGNALENNADFLFGSNTVFRTACLKDVGGYNPIYRTNYEDCDISYRLKARGYSLFYTPLAVCRHQRKDTLASVLNTRWRWQALDAFLNACAGQQNPLQAYLKLNYMEIAEHGIKSNLNNKCFQLLYFDFIFPFWSVLKDLATIDRNSGHRKKEQFKSTALAFIAAIHWHLKTLGTAAKPEELLVEDLLKAVDLLSASDLKALQVHFPDSGHGHPCGLSDWYRKLADLLPDAAIGFVQQLLQRFQPLFSFLGKDTTLPKMVEVSAARARMEESDQCSYYRDGLRVLIANPPWRVGPRAGVRAGSRWPFTAPVNGARVADYVPFPFFLAYTQALVQKEGFAAAIIDAIAEGLDDEAFYERVRGFGPQVLLMETATASFYIDVQYAKEIKRIVPDCTILFCGAHATAQYEEILTHCPAVDYVICGEFEFAFLEFCQHMRDGKPPNEIKGIASRDPAGRLTPVDHTESVDLDRLPLPERMSLPMYNYNDQFAGMPYPNVQVHASRGCPFRCSYCIFPQVVYGNNRYRVRDPIAVADELSMLVETYGFKGIYFDDDTFNIGNRRMLKLCRELQHRGLDKIPWGAMARADTSDFETLKAMKQAGMIAIKFGVESGVQSIVNACGKDLNLEKVAQACRWCREIGLKYHLTFTFGLPGETLETIGKSIQYALELAPDTCQFSRTTPFPGTVLFDQLKEKGLILTEDWSKYDGNRYTVAAFENIDSHELDEAIQAACRRWEEFTRDRLQSLSTCGAAGN